MSARPRVRLQDRLSWAWQRRTARLVSRCPQTLFSSWDVQRKRSLPAPQLLGSPIRGVRGGHLLGKLACLFLCLLAGQGCLPGYVRVALRADESSNQGRPLRVLVRSVDEQQFRAESYASVSALVIKPDATVLRSLIVEPTRRGSRVLWIKSKKTSPLGLYFFYAAPAASWKVWLQPDLPWRISVPLGRLGVDVEQVKECRIFRN